MILIENKSKMANPPLNKNMTIYFYMLVDFVNKQVIHMFLIQHVKAVIVFTVQSWLLFWDYSLIQSKLQDCVLRLCQQ